jgi:thiamine pyrophosphate-dependent acetolactate synthase large subunit-like protein
VPAALGVLAGLPGHQAIAVETPDGFLSNVQELACAFCEKLPVKVLLLRSAEARSDDDFDAVALARGFRAEAESLGDSGDLDAALMQLLDRRGPALLEVRLPLVGQRAATVRERGATLAP